MNEKEFQTIVLEIARVALADADLFDQMAEELDLSDEVMLSVRDKVHLLTSEA